MQVPLEALEPGGAFHLPEQASLFTRAKLAIRAMRVLAKDPEDGIAATIYQLSIDAVPYARRAEALRSTEQGRALLRERPSLEPDELDLPSLRQLPAGTLGRALAQYYVDNKIEPLENLYPIRTDVEYLTKRYREVHDVLHLITGYGTDPIGELEVQLFIMGNVGFRRALVTVLSAVLIRPAALPPFWTSFARLKSAYDRGRRSKEVVISPRYEHFWSLPLEQVRERVGVAA